jgi:ribosomal-protein-alanine N-acetyltransferase
MSCKVDHALLVIALARARASGTRQRFDRAHVTPVWAWARLIDAMNHPPEPRLLTRDILIRRGRQDDLTLIVDFFSRNKAHLAPFSPARPSNFYSFDYWRAAVRRGDEAFYADREAHCFVYWQDESAVIGTVNLSNFVRGVFQACHLGYSIDREVEGTGRMRAAVAAVVSFAFDELNMHRIMANYVPDNERSGRLLEALGFVREGVARDYLRIAGRWRDHVLTARINPDWREP